MVITLRLPIAILISAIIAIASAFVALRLSRRLTWPAESDLPIAILPSPRSIVPMLIYSTTVIAVALVVTRAFKPPQ